MLSSAIRVLRGQAVLVLVVVLGLAAAGAVALFEHSAEVSGRAQASIAAIEVHLGELKNAPISTASLTGRSLAASQARIDAETRSISAQLASLTAGGSPPASIVRVAPTIRLIRPVIDRIFAIGGRSSRSVSRYLPQVLAAIHALQVQAEGAAQLLAQAGRTYDQRATQAKRNAIIGSTATILILLSVFVFFFRQAKIARAEIIRLLAASQDEASTDPLTGIGNRRSFKQDLELLVTGADPGHEILVAMLDLDGFKVYNDTFGHAAGDALLARLAGRLCDAVAGAGTAYRMGGDEFCVVAPTDTEHGERLLHAAVAALTDTGEGWQIGSSWGVAWIGSETTGVAEALQLADERMYAQKTGRSDVGVQTTAALVQVLVEQDVDLSTHIRRVSTFACATAEALGIPEDEVARIGLAAQLHDIGKIAIPQGILSKPGPLTEDEWAFVRKHTLIGERIIAAAPSLAHTANLVRSSHERQDGSGYPDGLRGADIPLGSRIIAVCDAYDAMIALRPYQTQSTPIDAVAELRRCAGAQFDADVVRAFCTIDANYDPARPAGHLRAREPATV
jgi:diguanylate cyclase (GGDEF)-like protein